MKSEAMEVDRYKTFRGIDCDGNVRQLVTMLLAHMEDPEKNNRLLESIREKLDIAPGGRVDPEAPVDHYLLVIHSYINILFDLFERYEDQAACELLEKIESQSC